MHSQVLGANLSTLLPELAPVIAVHKMTAKKPGVSGQVPSAHSLLPLAPAAEPAQAATSCDARGWGWEEKSGRPSSFRKRTGRDHPSGCKGHQAVSKDS